MKKHPRALVLLAGILLLAACTKKTSPTSSQDHPETTPDSNPTTAAAPAPAPPATQPEPLPQVAQQPAPTSAPPPPPPPPPPPIVIPNGTVLTVRLQQAVGSKSSQQGDRFDATLSEPIVVKGETIAPAGTSASGTVTEAHAAGHFKGGATLGLALDRIVIRGRQYPIQTLGMSETSKGKGKRTGVMVGGGAGTGALIGGLAGGGKGAAIGALVGAGAGTAGAGLTGNRDITLAAESAVSFQMTHSLTIKRSSSSAAANAAETAPVDTAPSPQQGPPPQ